MEHVDGNSALGSLLACGEQGDEALDGPSVHKYVLRHLLLDLPGHSLNLLAKHLMLQANYSVLHAR